MLPVRESSALQNCYTKKHGAPTAIWPAMVVAVDVSRRSLGGAGVQLRELSRGRMAHEGVYAHKQRINGGGDINRRERNASCRAVSPFDLAITIGHRLRVHLTSIRSVVIIPGLLPIAAWRHRLF